MNDTQKQQILKKRARQLAKADQLLTQGATLEVLEFVLAREHYAVTTTYVREVYPLRDLTPLPCTPRHIRGIVNVRGQILAVVDLSRVFNMPGGMLADLNKIIVLNAPGAQFGVLVDEIVGVRVLAQDALQSAPPTLATHLQEYARGITLDHVLVLDAAKILNDDRLMVHEEIDA